MKIAPERTRADVLKDMAQIESWIEWAQEPYEPLLCKDDTPRKVKFISIGAYLP